LAKVGRRSRRALRPSTGTGALCAQKTERAFFGCRQSTLSFLLQFLFQRFLVRVYIHKTIETHPSRLARSA